MSLLTDNEWKLKYTPDDGDLVRVFYVPALESAVRYDRSTGYFSASALTLAARGIEALVRNGGHMRLVVGCTLDPPEIAAIEKGGKLRNVVEQHLAGFPLEPDRREAWDALELLAWMVAKGTLDVKIAVPCDENRQPIPAEGIFHEKAGILEDKAGNRLAWNGSLNETSSGWQHNWESINIFTSWGTEPKRVDEEEQNFSRVWTNHSARVITVDVPAAVKSELLRFLPANDRPARLKKPGEVTDEPVGPSEAPTGPVLLTSELRRLVWGYIRHAPAIPGGGEWVGEATAAVQPWPHQIKTFTRLYRNWPPKLLIADEVGLGKTIEAGLLLRQAWLAGKARRILILAPKAVLKQWQVELREKFNLNWPIYDGKRLSWYPSRAVQGNEWKAVGPHEWHKENILLTSSQLMRRQDRAEELLRAEPWDLVVLDEAHHARRKSAGTAAERGPNALLQLMRALKDKAQALLLLTATPMQVHPVEIWDLLSLLGLPPEWGSHAFVHFFEEAQRPNPSPEALDQMARLFQAAERHYGAATPEEAARFCEGSRLRASTVLRALRDVASVPRRQLENKDRAAAVRLMLATTPVGRLVSRHTRQLLRRYFQAGKIDTPIAERQVDDRFLDMSTEERWIYNQVEDFISSTYNLASEKERSAVGFVMTSYRRRLASSFHALAQTLERHLEVLRKGEDRLAETTIEEDLYDNAFDDEFLDSDEAAQLECQALTFEERSAVEALLRRIHELPPDSKLEQLKEVLAELRAAGYDRVMVFTQYTDTMDFLREQLAKTRLSRLMCYSGRGGEVQGGDGTWRVISRDDAKRRFRDGLADILLCTDAAAEGLNFQFCGAIVNYDMPWNPMRVEQRIGRIDRLGQSHGKIRILNLHYRDTVETDVYQALRNRIRLFESVVGPLQPILSQLPKRISQAVLSREQRGAIVGEIEGAVEEARTGFDLDLIAESDLEDIPRPEPVLDLDDLNRVIATESARPPGIQVEGLGEREYAYLAPGMAEKIRVTTDRDYFEEHSDSLELWSPGNPLFPQPDTVASPEELSGIRSMGDILSKRGTAAAS